MDKDQKLSLVVAKLQELTEFLRPYLPLANVHNTNFIVSRHWDTMIPEEIGRELLQLDDHELSLLPSGELYYHESDHELVKRYGCDMKDSCRFMNPVEANAADSVKQDIITTCNPNPESSSDDITHMEKIIATNDCDLTDAVYEKCNPSDKKTDVHDVLTPSHPAESSTISDSRPESFHSLAVPDWQHDRLREFIMSAMSCTLPQLGLLTSIAELSDLLALPSSDTQAHIVVSHAMKVKKSYEVDVMANICAWIAKGFSISNVSSSTLLCTECARINKATAVDVGMFCQRSQLIHYWCI